MSNLRLIVADNLSSMGPNINVHLNRFYETDENYLVDMDLLRFNNGEGKCIIKDDLTNDDVFILSDPNNYDITYDSFHGKHHMGPDEHMQDIRRIISAIGGRARTLNVIMPLLYQSRQDKRHGNESLDCAMMLRELEWLGVKKLITVDIHNSAVANATPFGMNLTSINVTNEIIENLVKNEEPDKDNLFIVSPDNGARNRAKYVADLFGVDYGFFDKRRNYDVLKDGKNPIEYHEFNGPKDLSGRTVIVVDDMIASGDSLISTATHLRELGAKKIFLVTTFALFTAGPKCFEDAHKKQIFSKLYTTNLSYIPNAIKKQSFINIVDCSKSLAENIYPLH